MMSHFDCFVAALARREMMDCQSDMIKEAKKLSQKNQYYQRSNAMRYGDVCQ